MIWLNQTFPTIDAIPHRSAQTGFAQLDANFTGLKCDASAGGFGVAPTVEIRMAPIDHLMAQFGKLERDLSGSWADLLFGLLFVAGTEGGQD
jgi:hypothetical protein